MDEPPTSEVVSLADHVLATPEYLPKRDRATLTFIDGPTAGAVVGISPGGSILIGRGATANVRLPECGLSREHARIRWERGCYVIDAIGSSGTWVDGLEVQRSMPLTAGARIQLGPNVRCRFDLHDEREQRVVVELHEAAMRDALTGAYTQRYLRERLHAELSYAARHRTPVALLMLDLDHFKRVNDRYGHPAGDEVLRAVAAELKKHLRPEDVLVRYGGEELCVLVRGLDGEGATLLAQRLGRAVRQLRVPIDGATVRVTVSIGVAAMGPSDEPATVAALVHRADRALYAAKRQGRDRTVLDREPE